jgi:hypothetical protein
LRSGKMSDMAHVIGFIVLAFIVVLAYAAITGRVRPTNGCCAPADPRDDLRMRTD